MVTNSLPLFVRRQMDGAEKVQKRLPTVWPAVGNGTRQAQS
jgi:hypothetical protein